MPVMLIPVVVSLPIAWLISLVLPKGGLVVLVIAFLLGFLLQLGTPPVYALILVLLTTIRPIGIPALSLVIRENGEVSMLTPNDVQELQGGKQ